MDGMGWQLRKKKERTTDLPISLCSQQKKRGNGKNISLRVGGRGESGPWHVHPQNCIMNKYMVCTLHILSALFAAFGFGWDGHWMGMAVQTKEKDKECETFTPHSLHRFSISGAGTELKMSLIPIPSHLFLTVGCKRGAKQASRQAGKERFHRKQSAH